MLKKILIFCLLFQNIYCCNYWREWLAGGLVAVNLSFAMLSFTYSSNCRNKVNQLAIHANNRESILLDIQHSDLWCNVAFDMNIAHFASFVIFILYISYIIKRNLRLQTVELHPRAHVNENMP